MTDRPSREDAETPQSLPLATLAASATAAIVIAQQVAGKAVRDAFYLTYFHVNTLPRVMIGSAGVSVLLVFVVSGLLAKYTPRRILPVLFLASAVGLFGEWALALAFPRPAAVLLYVHNAVVSPILISTFWSHVNEAYDPYTGKRAVARIAGGGTVGGLLGGLLTWRAASMMSLRTTILALALLNLLSMVGVLMSRGQPLAAGSILPPAPGEGGALAPIRLLSRAPFLRNLALLVAGGAAISSLLDYVFTAGATAAYGKGEALLAFFSLFGLVVSLASLGIQTLLGRVAAEKMGVVVNVGLLPGIILLGGSVGLAVPGLLSVSLLRGAELVYRNTLFRAAYEMLYTPISPGLKRTTKAVIDVGFDRLGTLIGAGLTAGAVLTFRPQTAAIGIVLVLAIVTGVLVRTLHRGYVDALEHSLRAGSLTHPENLPAARTTIMNLDEERAREQLIAQAEAMGLRPTEPGRARHALEQGRTLAAVVAALTSRSPLKVKKALTGWNGDMWPAAPFAIALMCDDALYTSARTALLALGPQVTGVLVDALTDPGMDVAVRRRVPRVLAECGTVAAAHGLLDGLGDSRFEVRYACGRALLHLTNKHPDIVLEKERVVAAVLQEIARRPRAAVEEESGDSEDDLSAPTLVDVMMRERVARNLEHLFTVLALALDREPLRLALRALHDDDPRHRGTALEYLQTTLPAEVREAMWPLIGDPAGPLPAPRPARDVLEELAACERGETDLRAGLTPSVAFLQTAASQDRIRNGQANEKP